MEGDSKGDFKQDMEGDLLSNSGQVKSRSGSVYSPNLILLSLTLTLTPFSITRGALLKLP